MVGFTTKTNWKNPNTNPENSKEPNIKCKYKFSETPFKKLKYTAPYKCTKTST